MLAGASSSFTGQEERKTLEIKLGESKIISTGLPFSRVSIVAPKIADVVVLSPKEAYVYGKNVGYTSMMLWEEGKGYSLIDIIVSLDLTGLKEKFSQLYPNQQIEVYGTETGIVLAGTVSGPEIVEQAVRLAKACLPKAAENTKELGDGTGRSSSKIGITNLLKVGGIQQVMLEVKIAEIQRDSGRDLQAAIGITDPGGLGSDWTNFRGSLGVNPLGVLSTGTLGQDAGTLLMNFVSNPANIFLSIDNFTAALNFLESEDLARVLAEPRLVTQSGKTASFLAGGELPIPEADGEGGITIKYKPYGVSLLFKPIVLSNGKIDLHVVPSVSEIANTRTLTVTGFSLPVFDFNTRQLDTSVQLNDGQTLAIGGLLQENIRETLTKVPYLGDIPILGALFRSSDFIANKTDLLISVTPHLVKPVPKETVKSPGDDMLLPDRYEFYMLGKLEGERKEAPEGLKAGGLEGSFGHQPISGKKLP